LSDSDASRVAHLLKREQSVRGHSASNAPRPEVKASAIGMISLTREISKAPYSGIGTHQQKSPAGTLRNRNYDGIGSRLLLDRMSVRCVFLQ
jgi:hypothetical protein